jgi:K+-sensing histidine kinase KdpD
MARDALTDGQAESVRIIIERGKELLHIISVVLESARLETKSLEFTRAPTSVASLVGEVIEQADFLTHLAEVRFVEEGEHWSGLEILDAERIAQAIMCILHSSVKLTRRGGDIAITQETQAEALVLHVRIEEVSVPRQSLKAVLAGYQSPEEARKHGCLGLGLALTKTIAESHQGSFTASEATGQEGNEILQFRLELPRKDFAPPPSRTSVSRFPPATEA